MIEMNIEQIKENFKEFLPRNMPILWILIGFAGSGKTTISRILWEINQRKTLRVCMDDIIQMMSFYEYETEMDPHYTDLERAPIIRGLTHGLNVIVDRTNLTPEIRGYFIQIGKFTRKMACELTSLGNEYLSKMNRYLRYRSEEEFLASMLESEMINIGEVKDEIAYYEGFHDMIKQFAIARKTIPLFGSRTVRETLLQKLDKISKLKINGLFFEIDPEICLRRRLNDPILKIRDPVKARDWKKIIDDMEKKMVTPELEEGFDSIYCFDEQGSLTVYQ